MEPNVRRAMTEARRIRHGIIVQSAEKLKAR
jgi:hypothetical protein